MLFRKSLNVALVLSLLLIPLLMSGGNANAAEAETHGEGKESTVKVMSYNIHHGVGEDGVLDLQRIAEVIKQSGADIIGLQEVDNHWSERSAFEDQAKWLATYLNMHYVYAANLDQDPLEEGQPRRQYGTAVLSKYPILYSKNHLLTNIPYPENPTEQRGLLETQINVKGNFIRFYNTHLDNKRAEQRDLQVREILGIAGQNYEPSIFVGDYNATPEKAEVLKMTAEYKDVFAELGQNEDYTYPAPIADRRIDYVFTSEDVKIQSADVITTDVSDHLPITAELTLARK